MMFNLSFLFSIVTVASFSSRTYVHARPIVDSPMMYKEISFQSDPSRCVSLSEDEITLTLSDCSIPHNIVKFGIIKAKYRQFSSVQTGYDDSVASCKGVKVNNITIGEYFKLVEMTQENDQNHVFVPCNSTIGGYQCLELYNDNYEPTNLCMTNMNGQLVLDTCVLDSPLQLFTVPLDSRVSLYYDNQCS
eukprot:Awhi_evm1s2042